ncbi:MAG: hypothetical protein MUC96_02860 [Myxococcaceae bacterium]|jgi:hypothetical protein|nr:hypothetical protein [Myxococcaceae bacterium]
MALDDFIFAAAIGALLISTIVLVVGLFRRKEPAAVLLRRWLSFIADLFWGSG